MVPFDAGAGTDIVARVVLEQLSVQLGQSIVVENRGGAGGTIGTDSVAKSKPDGYTILVNAAGHAIAPAIYPALPYNVVDDLSGVTALVTTPTVLVVASTKKIYSVQEFVSAGKRKVMTYASAGFGSASHLTTERFLRSAGIEGIQVPFKGSQESMREVMTERVDFTFAPTSAILPFIKDGRLRPLAVSSSKRSLQLPTVPTTIEAGYANSEFDFWVGLFVPSKTPRDIVDRLYQATVKSLEVPAIRKRLETLGAEPFTIAPDKFDAYVKQEVDKDMSLVKALGPR
jgi:tripartite-type tricarboxylate transporter receptor subunit TctC